MSVTTYSNARRNFRELINQVNDNSESVTITTNNKNAVLLSEEDYNAIMETLYLQQSPANARHLAQSISEYENNKTRKVDIETYE
ncbi:type II toxin-antitoxin system Phd/YefM family antitoxin [Staphylococcus pettenkoferi]|uniref:type II toxin-antitoxin system Phd/YefM family antitoxin n=1 Tax=Staphylococcus pettenkoferi TaxID=170573 RepID=UPI0025573B1C|nr:type II toxin-antitoxin system Phd/YefM family antitoxin [Staphylococcus pettenkoferi]MDK7284328.1 type II toxin-antitoxin system Phd/YefM family antitoxin [Staphylococcus pettenkoferi]